MSLDFLNATDPELLTGFCSPWRVVGPFWPPGPPPWPARSRPVVYVQCREAAWSANTVPPDWCWWGPQRPTRAVVACLRNGVECRCYCPPGRCEGKSGRQHTFRPWLAPPG